MNKKQKLQAVEAALDGIRPASAYCQNCGTYLTVGGWVGIPEGFDSKAANLKCECRYCWHCSDNRGRHEDHNPNCTGPTVPH